MKSMNIKYYIKLWTKSPSFSIVNVRDRHDATVNMSTIAYDAWRFQRDAYVRDKPAL